MQQWIAAILGDLIWWPNCTPNSLGFSVQEWDYLDKVKDAHGLFSVGKSKARYYSDDSFC